MFVVFVISVVCVVVLVLCLFVCVLCFVVLCCLCFVFVFFPGRGRPIGWLAPLGGGVFVISVPSLIQIIGLGYP